MNSLSCPQVAITLRALIQSNTCGRYVSKVYSKECGAREVKLGFCLLAHRVCKVLFNEVFDIGHLQTLD